MPQESSNLSVAQLRQALQLREQIDSLQNQLDSVLGGTGGGAGGRTGTSAARTTPRGNKVSGVPAGKRTMSAEARERIAAAQKARWARQKNGKGAVAKNSGNKATVRAGASGKKGGLTPEGRAKLAEAMRARWAARKKGGAAPNARAS